MKTLFSFISGIKSLVEKDSLSNVLDNTHVNLDDLRETLPYYTEYLEKNSVKSKKVERLVSTFYREFKGEKNKSQNIFLDILNAFNEVEHNLEVVLDFIESKEFPDNLVGTALGLKKAFALSFVDNLGFVIDYTNSFLDYYVEEELEVTFGTKVKTLNKYSIDDVEKNMFKFSKSLSNLGKPTKEFKKEFEKMSDIAVTEENSEVLEHSISKDFSLNTMFGFRYNPFLYLGKIVARYTASKYKERQKKIEYLNLRILDLENRAEGNSDPILQKEILINKDRVEKLEAENADIEEKLADRG